MSLRVLSEADVRLLLYPSSGRVVKVTEGYWQAADICFGRELCRRGDDGSLDRPQSDSYTRVS